MPFGYHGGNLGIAGTAESKAHGRSQSSNVRPIATWPPSDSTRYTRLRTRGNTIQALMPPVTSVPNSGTKTVALQEVTPLLRTEGMTQGSEAVARCVRGSPVYYSEMCLHI